MTSVDKTTKSENRYYTYDLVLEYRNLLANSRGNEESDFRRSEIIEEIKRIHDGLIGSLFNQFRDAMEEKCGDMGEVSDEFKSCINVGLTRYVLTFKSGESEESTYLSRCLSDEIRKFISKGRKIRDLQDGFVKGKKIIREAIVSLQSKGIVINPNTIADEIRNTPSLFGQWPSFNRRGDEKIVYPNKVTEILNTNGIRFVSKDASRSDGSSDSLDDILSEADSTFRDDNLIDALEILKYLLSVECFLSNIQKQYIKLSLEGLEPKEIRDELIIIYPDQKANLMDSQWFDRHVGLNSFRERLKRYLMIRGIEEL